MKSSSGNDVYLETYVLQQDMRVRMPKAIISNLGAIKGETLFDIYINAKNREIILKIHEEENDD